MQQSSPGTLTPKYLNLGYTPLSTNYGYFLSKIPLDIFNLLKPEVDYLSKDFNSNIKVNHTLVGEIQNEFEIDIPEPVNDYVYQEFLNFEKTSNFIKTHYFNSVLSKFTPSQAWVNFQKATEYNPMHNHTGVISWVIWYQIPYTLKEQLKFSVKADSLNGCFSFLYSLNENLFDHPKICHHVLSSDNKIEGHMAIFPSSLDHIVYPFYGTDKYRITISGNINMAIGG